MKKILAAALCSFLAIGMCGCKKEEPAHTVMICSDDVYSTTLLINEDDIEKTGKLVADFYVNGDFFEDGLTLVYGFFDQSGFSIDNYENFDDNYLIHCVVTSDDDMDISLEEFYQNYNENRDNATKNPTQEQIDERIQFTKDNPPAFGISSEFYDACLQLKETSDDFEEFTQPFKRKKPESLTQEQEIRKNFLIDKMKIKADYWQHALFQSCLGNMDYFNHELELNEGISEAEEEIIKYCATTIRRFAWTMTNFEWGIY